MTKAERTRPFSTPEVAAAYAERRYATTLQRGLSHRETALLEALLEEIGPVERLLDLPVGYGRFTPLLAPRARLLLSADISWNMLREARQRRGASFLSSTLGEAGDGAGGPRNAQVPPHEGECSAAPAGSRREDSAAIAGSGEGGTAPARADFDAPGPGCRQPSAAREFYLALDGARLPLRDRSLDLSVTVRLLQHLHEREVRLAVLRELGRVTRGRLVVTFYRRGTLHRLQRLVKEGLRLTPKRITFLGLREFVREAEAAGLRVERLIRLRRLVHSQTFAVLVPR